jgi:hypothetical protein
MGAEQSTRRYPKCDVELLEENMMKHTRECVTAIAKGYPDGRWKCTYQGPSSGVSAMTWVVSDASRAVLGYKQ